MFKPIFLAPKLSLLVILFTLTSCSNVSDKQPETHTQQASPVAGTRTLRIEEQALYAKAVKLLNNDSLPQAVKILEKLSLNHPLDIRVSTNLAIAYFKSSHLKKSEAMIKSTLKLNPELPDLHNLLGLISVKNNKIKEAEKHYQKAIQLDKDFANCHYNIGLLYDIYYQDLEKALIHYNRYLGLIKFEDKETVDWVEQLKYSMSRE